MMRRIRYAYCSRAQPGVPPHATTYSRTRALVLSMTFGRNHDGRPPRRAVPRAAGARPPRGAPPHAVRPRSAARGGAQGARRALSPGPTRRGAPRGAPFLVALAPAHAGFTSVVGLLAAPAELPARLLLFLSLAHGYARPPANRWSCSARVGGAMSSVTSHCATAIASPSSASPTRERAVAR